MASSSSKHSSSMSSLYPELLEQIFLRAPGETLIRLKATCKQWNALISNSRFIYEHFDHSSERFIRLRTNDREVRIMDPVTKTRSDTPIPNEFQEPNKVYTILHCDGIILCIRRDYGQFDQPRRSQIAIWNPLLRRVKWINPSLCLSHSSVYGIGYKTRGEGYKIVRFSNSWFRVFEGDTKVEVYDFKNSSWRTLDDVKVDVRGVDSKGVAVLGNMYWLSQNNRIIGFDFTAETLKEVCSCPPFFFGDCCYLSCFREGRLSLLQQAGGESKKIEVWRSNNLADESISFTKYFHVDRPNLPALYLDAPMPHPVYCFVKPTSIFALCERDEGDGVTFTTYGVLYEIDEGGLHDQTETETETERSYGRVRFPIFTGHVYVPSLVALP